MFFLLSLYFVGDVNEMLNVKPIYFEHQLEDQGVTGKIIDTAIDGIRNIIRIAGVDIKVKHKIYENTVTCPHYTVQLVNIPLHNTHSQKLVAKVRPYEGLVISYASFAEIPEDKRLENFMTVLMHHCARMFGLVSPARRENLEICKGVSYCTNECIMRSEIRESHKWSVLSAHRLRFDAFCKECKEELTGYFEIGNEQ